MSITVIRTNTSGARGEVAAYLADANNRVEENGTPAIPPPTEDQLQEPVFPPQEPLPKRKRGGHQNLVLRRQHLRNQEGSSQMNREKD